MEPLRAFDTSHPSVPAVCLCSIVLLGMLVFQPIYEMLFLLGAVAFLVAAHGLRPALRRLVWMVPMLALVCVANPLFSASGSTELLRIGPVVVYAESLAYGACMGALLVASITWMGIMAELLPSDKVFATAGRVTPTVTLMMSIASGLVPQLACRARELRSVRSACTCSGVQQSLRNELADESVMLVSWALEDSLERADAMRARGWGARVRRTSYRPYQMTERDMVALAALVLLAVASAGLGWVASTQWRFYPTMAQLVWWWGYLPYGVLCFVPTFVAFWQRRIA